MSDKERLNGIIIRYKTVKPFEFYNDIGIIAMDEKDKDWLIEQAEKVEQLQQEIEEWKLENQSLSGSVEIIERKRQELVKQLAIANERIERYEEFIRKIAWWDTFPANPFKAEAEQLLKETK